ncbi:uncharacterized protein LOC142220640 [Haematobia irritans]|uniref:uncharacterized protein LOC142220640 n=1 Tax=Haematobia irritans TaxID=7368 RepID=UPI003F4FBF71
MSETDFNCNKCDLKDTDRMVQCDSCDKWFHFECVKVDSNIANVSWSCSCCVEQPVDSGDKSNATQQLPPVDDTTDFTTGTRAASSPATGNGTTVQQNAVHQPFTQIGLPSAQVSTSQRGAYANAHNLNLENQGSSTLLPNVTMPKQISSMAPTNTTMTLPARKEQYIQRHFNNSNGSNVSPCNSSSQTQLQLQMLEEEKELQRQYLEKKYHILSQGNLSQPSSSFANNTTSFHPTPTQIAARQVIPKELPNFDGNPEDWPLFISNYRNSTEIAGYSDGENLMRLQSCLRGRAKELVKSKLLIPSMVNEIIQTLEMCFGRPEHILDSMIEKATKTRSSVTLMEHEFYNQLGLKGESEPLELKWTGNTTRSEDDSVRLNVEVSGVNGSKYVIYNVHTVQNLGLPTQSLDFESIVKDNPYFKGLPIQSYENVKPTILIGVNNWRVAVPLKVREGGRNLLIATKTRLGWTLQGCGSGVRKSFSLNIHTCACEDRYKNLHDEVKEYFALEVAQEKTLLSLEDQKAMQILENNVIRKGQQFEVSLLWKDENPVLPESYEVACHRLKCLQKKFKKDPQLQQTMQVEIDKLLNKGYARKVTNSEFNSYSRTWYLPIFVALNPNKPGKVRLVWDAAAKSNNKSLNDFLMSGPDLLTSLINVLLEFRVGQIAICGDIAEMFHRINVNDVDMHAQRFLWIKDGEVIAYVMKALTFGTSCAPCIANFVRNKNAEDFRDLYPRAVKAINFYHYMDDFIDSVQTEEEAIKLANQVKTIHAKGGFHMRNWASNSNIVRQKLAEGGAATENSFGAVEKILGMYWESNNDVFQYNCRFSRLKRNVFQRHTVPTKREVLQVLMSIFDPLGFVSHYTISLKILLQDIWRSAIKWDDELNEDLHIKWCSWLSNLEKISTVSIPRCYSRLLKSTFNVQLHTFVDAGENAYAAVCYFRIQYQGEVDVRIVAAKGKVSPLKPVSIPRLELQAALIGARLSRKIIKITRLNCTECFYWSDSKTVLKWLSMDPKNFKAFVMYRVGEILELTNLPQWNWVPSKLNPADFATKVCSAEDDMWFQGPEFLKDNEDVWPKCSDLGRISYEEVRNHLLHVSKSHKFFMNIEYFSCWRRLYRALAQFLFYMEKLKSVVQRSNVENDTFFECIQKSKYILYKYAQKSEFSEEIWHLKNKKPIEKDSILKQLNICLDENYVIRAYGRAEMLNCNNAIILPTNHYITFLVVKYYHENYHHCLHEATISRIKSNFYIPKLRVVYKKVRSSCQHCKNLYAVPRPPQMATLPSARLSSFERPFTYVGIDFFGPLFVTVGRHREKRWGVLFTCLTVRAIHIEVAHSLDTSSCILCIQNFISRRGSPKEIYTDNGTNFKAVEKILREEKQHIDLHQVFSKYDDIKWRFNPPAAPHMGGAWERLIRTVKSVLYSMLPAFKFNDETLRSALYEIEFMINSRPLTFVALDSDDDDALTPNHLLLGSAGGQKPLCEFDYDLRQRWHNTQNFANHFWRRWVREYGPHLVRRSKWLEKVQPPSKGDVVIIVDDNLPRNSWPKGIVTELYTAKDGQVRSVKVKTTSSTYERPVTKIAILDVGKRSESKLLGT